MQELCIRVAAANFESSPSFGRLNDKHVKRIINILPLDLPLELIGTVSAQGQRLPCFAHPPASTRSSSADRPHRQTEDTSARYTLSWLDRQSAPHICQEQPSLEENAWFVCVWACVCVCVCVYVQLIQDEDYWKRRCHARWKNLEVSRC